MNNDTGSGSITVQVEDESSQVSSVISVNYASNTHGNTTTSTILSLFRETYSLETSILIDISDNKGWIACITSDQRLIIRQLPTLANRNDTVALAYAEIDIQQWMVPENQTHKFLSVSPDGMRAALSFFKMNDYYQPTPHKNEKCYIFEKDATDGKIMLRKELQAEGRAVFLNNRNLALLNEDVMKVYDCLQSYTKIHWLDLRPLTLSNNLEAINRPESDFNTPWADFARYSSAEAIIKISKHIRQNILTTPYYGITRAWLLTEDGVRLTSFYSASPEEIMAFSPGYKFFATVVRQDNSINIYNAKCGTVISHLQPHFSAEINEARKKNGKENKYRTDYAYFSQKTQYLVIISIDKVQEIYHSNAIIIFQVWDIFAEKLIYQVLEKIRVNWAYDSADHTKFVHPFVIETEGNSTCSEDLPMFIAVYSTMTDGNKCELQEKSIHIYKDTYPLAKDGNETHANLSNENWVLLEEPSFYHAVQFQPIYLEQKTTEYIYTLRFGSATVQLWRRKIGFEERNIRNDELLYIRAFKAPLYRFNSNFRENYIRNEDLEDDGVFNAENVIKKSMKLMKNNPKGRIVVTIHSEKVKTDVYYNDEEIYLPLDDLNRNSYEYEDEPHYIESACQALHYLRPSDKKVVEKYKKVIFDKTMDNVKKSILKMKRTKSPYFTTISGNNTLAMLTSFPEGRDIIFDILKTQDLAVNLFSYVTTENEKQPPKPNVENALTLLIDISKDDLFTLLFNKILLHSRRLGTGSFSALTDAIVYLQDSGNADLLLKSCQKLSYLHISKEISTVLPTEAAKVKGLSTLYKSTEPDFKDLQSFSTLEEIPKYYNDWLLSHLIYWWSTFITSKLGRKWRYEWYIFKCKMQKFSVRFFSSIRMNESALKLCVVPLYHFGSYFNHEHADVVWRNNTNIYMYYFGRWLIGFSTYVTTIITQVLGILYKPNISDASNPRYKRLSTFMQVATNQHENDIFFQGDTAVSIFLQHKWRAFARRRFCLIYFIHLTYYISYSVGVLFSRNVFGYILGTAITDRGHLACIILMFISGGILFLQEMHQLIHSHDITAYFLSFYNAVDIIALVLPGITFWQIRNKTAGIDELSSICTIILWLHGILRLRVISFIGLTLETIFQLIKAVYKVLFMMLLVIFAFTQAFMVLLSQRDDFYFQEKYEGSINLTSSGATFSADNSANYNDSSANNNFNNPFKAFSILWFFIYGVWDPINDGDVGDNYTVMVLAILFSFIILLLFFNLVIALMSSKAEEVKKRGKKVWISHFAAVIAEIEQLWCTNIEMRSCTNNPAFIYYYARAKDVQNQYERLLEETSLLIQKMQSREDDTYNKSETDEIIDMMKNLGAYIEGAALRNREELSRQWKQIDLKINN